MDTIRLAIVGCGAISQVTGKGFIEHPNSEVYALCDPIRERAEQRAREWGIEARIYTSYDDVLNDSNVDAVELLTPTHMHPDQILAGLDAGKHVSCQKPISVTVAEADEIEAAASKASTKCRISENYLFYPPLVKAKELLDSGAIGEPSSIRTRTVTGKNTQYPGYAVEPDALEWRRDPALNSGGMIYDGGWHKIATATWLAGEVENVSAIINRSDDFMNESPSIVIWKYKDKECIGSLEDVRAENMAVRAKYYPLDDFFEIQGSEGAIWVTRCTGEMLDLPPVIWIKGDETVSFQVPSDWIEGFNGAAANFIDSIVRDEQPAMDIRSSRHVLQIILAAYQASETGQHVSPAAMV